MVPSIKEESRILAPEDSTRPESPRRRWLHGLWLLPLTTLLLTVVMVLPTHWIDPPTSAFIELYGGTEAREHYTWVEWDDVSPQVAIALVASEDQRFPSHRGIDVEAIRKALAEDGQLRGASTISQQVAKNMYLWAGRSWVRKGLEAYLTVAIETLWSKQRILEVYMNIAEFGPATYGIGAASREFFGVAPNEITPRQAALLAVVLPSPSRMSPARPSAYMKERATWVREQVRLLGGVSYLDSLD